MLYSIPIWIEHNDFCKILWEMGFVDLSYPSKPLWRTPSSPPEWNVTDLTFRTAPRPPILGEPNHQSPQNWGIEGVSLVGFCLFQWHSTRVVLRGCKTLKKLIYGVLIGLQPIKIAWQNTSLVQAFRNIRSLNQRPTLQQSTTYQRRHQAPMLDPVLVEIECRASSWSCHLWFRHQWSDLGRMNEAP